MIVAAGAKQSYFGPPEFTQHAPGMKRIDHALELRGRIFGAFEMAERETDLLARRRWLTFVVIGAGPTGVEIAGQLVELSHSLKRKYRSMDPSETRIILLDPPSSRIGLTRWNAGEEKTLDSQTERRLTLHAPAW